MFVIIKEKFKSNHMDKCYHCDMPLEEEGEACSCNENNCRQCCECESGCGCGCKDEE